MKSPGNPVRCRMRDLPQTASLLLALLAAPTVYAQPTELRIAVPMSYRGQVDELTVAGQRCASLAAHKELCVRFVVGNDYQVLQWFQNGQADGAVLPPLAAHLLRKNDARFQIHRTSPIGDLKLRRYRPALQASRGGEWLADPKARLDEWLAALLESRDGPQVHVELGSHFSPALARFVADVSRWLDQRPAEQRKHAVRVWNGLVKHLRFTVHGEPRVDPSRSGELTFMLLEGRDCQRAPTVHCLSDAELGDVFVVRKQALPPHLATGTDIPPADGGEANFFDWLRDAKNVARDGPELGSFASGNYVAESTGSRARYRFLFTLDELRSILRPSDPPGEGDAIALVLTGGGVKAAYQTKLIDHLYSSGYLRNTVAIARTDSKGALPVKYVIGTSGGALLGVFVAAIRDGQKDLNFSDRLWRRGGSVEPPIIGSEDVFPLVDLMRWLSLVYCLLIFALVCAGTLLYRRYRRGAGEAASVAVEHGGRFWRVSIWWLALLIATPWFIKYVNGERAAEHIPVVEGIFYFAYCLIAIYSDNRVSVVDRPLAPRGSPVWPIATLAAGTAMAMLALAMPYAMSAESDPLIKALAISTPALMACAGILLVFIAIHWYFERCSRRLELNRARPILSAFVLLAGVCVVSYALFIPLALFDYATVFELTIEFWWQLGGLAVIVSLALLYAAYGKLAPAAIRRRLKPSVDFLLSPHQARKTGHNYRYARIILLFALAWAWWNVVVAPGLYGNQTALNHFREIAKSVVGAGEADREAPEGPLRVDFQTFFAAPVTSLEKKLERYILFQPQRAYSSRETGEQYGPLGYRNWLTITNDPRWVAIDNANDQAGLLVSIAFASGSPFPVFPAHRIDLPGIGRELLVDGGYAHNIPIEAARKLGANRVLIISSSPREPAAQSAPKEGSFELIGSLTWTLRRLLPYLYERSQIEDVRSGEDIFVASVAPSASPADWPFLTDFRRPVIERMFREAKGDLERRIASVESWGNPTYWRRAQDAGRPRSDGAAIGY